MNYELQKWGAKVGEIADITRKPQMRGLSIADHQSQITNHYLLTTNH